MKIDYWDCFCIQERDFYYPEYKGKHIKESDHELRHRFSYGVWYKSVLERNIELDGIADQVRIVSKKVYVILDASCNIVGSSKDFYAQAAASLQKLITPNFFPQQLYKRYMDTLDEALETLKLLQLHIKSVCDIPSGKRLGASQFWKPTEPLWMTLNDGSLVVRSLKELIESESCQEKQSLLEQEAESSSLLAKSRASETPTTPKKKKYTLKHTRPAKSAGPSML